MQGSSRGSEVAITEEERDHFQMICFTYQSFNALKKKRQTGKQFYIDLEETSHIAILTNPTTTY